MKISSLAKYAVGVTLAAAMLAACSSGGSSFGPTSGAAPSGHHTGLTQLSKIQDAALTMPHFMARPVHPDHGQSFMRPDKKGSKSAYLYVGDWDTNDVYVYDYPSGTAVGTLTGFGEPYGMCTDKKGDVYVANFEDGNAVEYAHGGTSPINTYASGGEPIGCSVSAKGDVAVTSFSPGEVVVYAGGNPSKSTTYSDSSCEYEWPAGYDSKGDLIGVGEYSSIDVCALMAGSKSEEVLSESGITIDFPGGTSWDGKYIGLGDQEAGGTFESGDWPSTISGTTIKGTTETKLSDTCYSDYDDTVSIFYTNGKKNIFPHGKKQANTAVGPNLWCADAGTSKVDYWKYPAGGNPTGNLTSPPGAPYGAAVSIGK
ncbi:MAG TPA: hypothetical protein VGX91_04205 [Candidatus Cybelea sp.]|jgi:hypothetical protein|nr:hypothetical protein [Candidatus Cybelea sp.]